MTKRRLKSKEIIPKVPLSPPYVGANERYGRDFCFPSFGCGSVEVAPAAHPLTRYEVSLWELPGAPVVSVILGRDERGSISDDSFASEIVLRGIIINMKDRITQLKHETDEPRIEAGDAIV